MDFRLIRIILIDSYCSSRIVELDISGHITINGENGAGKTTLLRLLPIFFGESPSRIIRSDAVTERFGRYYFPTAASYIIFEYQRRNQKALAVIHPDGQSSDGVVYRFIDSEYKPELFKDGTQIIQSRDLYRHLDKQGIFDSKPLTLHSYKQIIQNTAGRDHRSLASRFSFTGSASKLTHLERVVTGILQRATTFYDLKRMVVSSVLSGEEAFSMRTGKKDLLLWINEYEAHRGLMDKTPLMSELEQADQYRRITEAEFSILHARVKLLDDYLQEQVKQAEHAHADAKEARLETEEFYRNKLQVVTDKKFDAEAKFKLAKTFVEQLDSRKRQYDEGGIGNKVIKVKSISSWMDELNPLKVQLGELENQVKSVTEIFNSMELDAKNLAREQTSQLDKERGDIYKNSSALKDELAEAHKGNLNNIRQRQEPEIEAANKKVTELLGLQAGLEVEVRNAQADPELLVGLERERKKQTEASNELENLHENTESLQKVYNKVYREFVDIELQVNAGEVAIEEAETDLEKLLAADNASEDTLLGFLRRNKPNWAANIGRLVSSETLLRNDLAPQLGQGNDLYGVSIDVDKLKAGRFSSEETIQQEINSVRNRIAKREAEVEDDRKALGKKKLGLDKSKEDLVMHEAEIAKAKNKKKIADDTVLATVRRVEASKQAATKREQESLDDCRNKLKLAKQAVVSTKMAHREELTNADKQYAENLVNIKNDENSKLSQIETRKKDIQADLSKKLTQISNDRDESLLGKGVSAEVLNGIRKTIDDLEGKVAEANGLKSEVAQYQIWNENSWPLRNAKQQEWNAEHNEYKRYEREYNDLAAERTDVLEQKQKVINDAATLIEKNSKLKLKAMNQLNDLAIWPQNIDTLKAGVDQDIDIEVLAAERKRLNESLDEHREKIRLGVDEIRRQMSSVVGTGPEKFHATALKDLGYLRPGKEHEWLEVFRNWFNAEHITNRTSLLQLGKTMALNISSFWKSLDDFKRSVTTFATDLKSNLEQGRIFDSISDVTIDIKAHVDTQSYWEAVGNLHREYEAWHTHGDPSLPPASFVAAAKEVASVIGDDKGLVADPVDLISLKISANVNNQGMKTANNEHELANMSSNGLSYIILCVILIGFVNRIRRAEPVVVPFVVDELKDLSFANAKTLLNLLTRNNITMVSAFPDVDLDLAELFERNYKILPGRRVGLINLDNENEEDAELEVAHV